MNEVFEVFQGNITFFEGNSQTEKVHNASENHSQDVPKHSTRNKKTLENQLKDQTRPTKLKGIEQEMV